MRTLLKYLRPYRKECVLGPLFKLLEASFELLIPLVVAAIIDTGIPNGDRTFIVQRVLLMAGLGFIGMLAAITAQYFSAKAAVGFAATLRHELFRHILCLPYEESEKVGTSALITRMTGDINQVQTGVNLTLRLFLRSPFIVFGAMIMAFTVDAKTAWIFTVVIPLLSLVVFGILLGSRPLFKKVQAGSDELLHRTRQNLTGVRVIRAFNRQEDEAAGFRQSSEALTNMQLYAGRISALMNPLTYVIVNCGICALILRGGVRVDSGAITQGAVVALVNYMSQILVELVKLANLIITLSKAFVSADRIGSVLNNDADLRPEAFPSAGTAEAEELVFDHVSMTYPNAGDEALSDISFTLPKGKTLGIIGGTGSGKSTLINLIPRFFDISSGAIRWNGQDIRSMDIHDLRSRIGIVPQHAVLFKGTIRENLLWGNPDASDPDLLRALEQAQAADFVNEKPGGLDAPVEQEGRNFSGGQRQRLTIARALVCDPQLLILDDSASALDYATDARLRKAIRSLNEEMSVIIISQRTASVQGADRILVLDDGRAVGYGTHAELLDSCPIYREIYEINHRDA